MISDPRKTYTYIQLFFLMIFLSTDKKLTLSSLMMTQEAFVDNVDQDQTAQNVQSDL